MWAYWGSHWNEVESGRNRNIFFFYWIHNSLISSHHINSKRMIVEIGVVCLKLHHLRPPQRGCACAGGERSASHLSSIKALWGSAAGDLSGNLAQIFSDHSGPHHAAACRPRPSAIWSRRFNQEMMTLASLSDDELAPRLLLLLAPGHTSLKIIALKAVGVVKKNPKWRQRSS